MLSLRLGLRSLLLSVAAFASVALTSARASPPALRVHPDGHYLQTADGRPFFWLGDTAWELFHRTTREEASYYLATRARQGFTVIQAVALAEFNGIRQPDALGQRPFIDEDPTRPNEAYFDRLVEIVDEAAARGLYVAVLPTWADKLTAPWGDGPRLFRLDNLPVARGYARYLGAKLKGRTNVIWMLGGDRPPRLDPAAPHPSGLQAGFPPGQDWRPIWREIAAGLAEGTATTPLCLYHPGGGMRTAPDLHGEPWLAVNGMQSGHGGGHDVPVWDWVARDFALTPAKPTLDLEPNYEDHPVNPWPEWDPASGYFRDYDVRKQTYRSVLAGACGVTYGNHSVWGFQSARNGVINHGERDWINALDRPGARQMRFLRLLVESRPFFRRIPDDSLFTNPSPAAALHMTASRDRDGSYAFIYFPLNEQTATIHLGQLGAGPFRAWWFDPRTGFAHPIGTFDDAVSREFKTPPYGPDWVLVLDRAAANYGAPGAAPLP